MLPAVVRLAMLVGQNESLCPVNLLGEAVARALGLLPAFVGVIWPALVSLLGDPYCFAICVVRLLVSYWPLLRLLAQVV
jgi:hypothetical protein